MNCPDYHACPLCYGCRNYDSAMLRCQKCAEHEKFNICNRKLHTEAALSRMIRRPFIDLDKKVAP